MDPNADVAGTLARQRVAIGILGPCFVGWCLQLWLSGVCTTAFYSYAKRGHFSRDTLTIKTFTAFVFILNTVLAFCSGVEMFHWGSTQTRTSAELWTQTPLDCLLPFLTGLMAFLVQGWFLRRTALLFRTRTSAIVFTAVVFLLQLTALAGSIGVAYLNFITNSNSASNDGARYYAITNSLWLWSSCTVDVGISGTLSYLLKAHVVGFNQKTDSTLVKIIKLSIETASYTAVMASIAAIISDVTINTSSFFTADIIYAFWVPLPSLYTLSLLTTLESRDRLSQELTGLPVIVNCGPRTASEFASANFPGTTDYVNFRVDVSVEEDRRLEDEIQEEKDWRSSRDQRRYPRRPHGLGIDEESKLEELGP